MTETKEEVKQKGNKTEAVMTRLMSFEALREQELRLHDAEFRGKHYFDFRYYEKKSGGLVPSRRGIRIDRPGVDHLEDAIAKWKDYLVTVEGHSTDKKSA